MKMRPPMCRRGSRRVATWLAAATFAVLLLSARDSTSMLPLYVNDWHTKMHSGSVVLQPKLAEIVRDHAVVYMEGAAAEGDAEMFAPGGEWELAKSPSAIGHYFHFGAVNSGGMPAWMDPNRTTMDIEDNFYHTTDPSGLSAWRVGTAVALHWLPDMRFVPSGADSDLQYLRRLLTPDQIAETYCVERYRITRIYPGGESDYFDVPAIDWDTTDFGAPNSFYISDTTPGTAIGYMISSSPGPPTPGVPPVYAPYSLWPATIAPETEPHFWTVKRDYQEAHLAGVPWPILWPVRFYVDRLIEPAYLSVKRALSFDGLAALTSAVATHVNVSFDAAHGAWLIECDFQTDLADMNDKGGVAYFLEYDDPSLGAQVRCPSRCGPADRPHQFFWSSVNNRVMGRTWQNYLMNCEGGVWPATVTQICCALGRGDLTPPESPRPIAYERILWDTVLGVINPTHNFIKPCEYNASTCRVTTTANIKAIAAVVATAAPSTEIVLNSQDLYLVDSMVADGLPAVGIGGFMDENFVDRGYGIQRLLEMAWKFRGHPFKHNVLYNAEENAMDVGDRLQAATAFMMVRPPVTTSEEELSVTFGWGDAQTNVVAIYPEQFIDVREPSASDGFSGVQWPDAAGILNAISSPVSAIDWIERNAPGLIVHDASSGRTFVTRWWPLNDGLPSEDTFVLAVWDVSPLLPPPPSASYVLDDVLDAANANNLGTSWSILEPDSRTVVNGGVLTTTPVPTGEAISTWAGGVHFYFTRTVHSPNVAAAASEPMPAGHPRSGTLKINASHWNQEPLVELRVDGSQCGWGDNLELFDGNYDGVYTCEVENAWDLAADEYSLPVVAIGNDGLRTYTDVNVTTVAVPDIAIDDTATYPLLAQSHDGKVVLAVNVTSYVPLNPALPVEVTAPTIFGNSTPVVLWDDGQAGLRLGAEDAIAGDGIFTSDRTSGVVNAVGTFSADVVVHPVTGNPVSGTVSVTSILSRAEFADKTASSGDIGMNEGVSRYAMAYANTSSDHVSGKKIMIVTFADAATPPMILENQSSGGSAPDFADRSGNWLGEGATYLPEGSRGVCFGDFGGGVDGKADGKQDFFLCGATGSHLYKNSGTLEAPAFVDVTEAAFPSATDRARIAGAMSAAWSDFDLDGDLDLFVATSNYGGPMSEIGGQVGVTFGGAFFTNDGNGNFQYRSAPMLSSSESGLTGAWAQLVPGRRWPYLVLPWISGDNCMVAYCLDGGFELRVMVVTGEPLSNLNSIAVCDYNHDNRPDLLVTDRGGGGKAAILRNDCDPATGYLSFHVACVFGEGKNWSGATVADFDGNGQDDILLLPESGAPALYMAQSYSTVPAYTVDLAFTLGLRAGATSGCVVTDQGGTRLSDVSLGRAGKRLMYQNMRNVSGPHPGRWVEISLGSVGNSNSSLIGTAVTIQQAGKSWTKLVDGGSGRGGQDANSFRFFLEEDASNVAVSVNYPSGDSDFLASVPVDSVYAVVEDTPVTLKTGTKTNPDPTFNYELGPGTMDWVFRWRTVGIKGDQRQDTVTIENYVGYTDTNPCYIGIESGTPLVLHWGDPGVTFNISWDGTDWIHEARWAGLPCASGCQYRFKVTSGIGNGVTTTSAQAKVIPALEFCMPDPDPNQQ